MDNVNLYLVEIGDHYDGPLNQWVFVNETDAKAKFEELKSDRYGDADFISIKGPFAPGGQVGLAPLVRHNRR